ncbi:cell division cycle-associated protein 7 [Trifolium pratense]|uniref:cell division cycle-associated protein 7 n=1 Tax=Trifolium pratense TaxID=57577 RepID=UPI001E692314|nr:cell division cycle-associated protein 7 [Trifolium pratense]
MPPLGKRRRREIDNPPQPVIAMDNHQSKKSEYELAREERIRENRERMGKFGIFDLSLSLKLKPNPPSRRTPSNAKSPISIIPPAPSRRSSRLQNVAPISYSEVPVKKEKGEKNTRVVIEEGSRPEIYTEEHEKLLGNTEKTWELFVDGVGTDGKRIYDSFRGKTCHQCRQKTLGYRTCCCECNMVQGQFCGDCLYMRYGEHVLEALADPTWKCPVCRGICNCSLCRQAKGWAPTGALYKKISRLGYKSVAHYLIQTRRADTDVEKNDDASNPVSAKRSLPFSDADDNKSHEVNENKLGSMQSLAETDGDGVVTKRSLIFPDEQDQVAKLEKVEGLDTIEPLASHEVNENKLGSVQPLAETETYGDEVATEKSLIFPDEQDQLAKLEKVEDSDTEKPLVSSTKASPDEQDQLVKLENVEGSDTVKLLASSTKASPYQQDQIVTLEKVKGSDTIKPLASSTKPCPDSIAGRLRSRRKNP